jgi:hypothetical protein
VFEERLRQIGQWLSVNGEAIYKSKPWKVQNDETNSDVWYTANSTSNAVYAILLKYPTDTAGKVVLTSTKVTNSTQISLLGYDNKLHWTKNILLPGKKSRNYSCGKNKHLKKDLQILLFIFLNEKGITIDLSDIDYRTIKSQWAWTFKLTNLQ